MALWLAVGIGITCLLIGYASACWAEGSSRGDLELENFHLEIELARLKREAS